MISAAAPSEIELELAAVTVPPSRNAGFSVGILSGLALGGCSSVATSVSALPAFTLTGAISQAKSPLLIARLARSSEVTRIGVLRVPGELIGFRAILGERPHEPPLVIGVLKPVEEHVIEGAAVAHAVARARAVEQIGRVAHALHAAGDDDVGRAGAQKVVGDHGGLHARAAHLVDGRRARRERQAGADRRLPRRRLPLPRRQHAAHQDFVDAVGGDPCPLDGGRNRARAERMGRRVLQVAEKAAHRRARRADDDDGICGGHGAGLRLRRSGCARSFEQGLARTASSHSYRGQASD